MEEREGRMADRDKRHRGFILPRPVLFVTGSCHASYPHTAEAALTSHKRAFDLSDSYHYTNETNLELTASANEK
ncbi:hypothetical protein E2C01_050227 [Portunus trituberculatus]|uniref:Uncharacterized protein n=1 Tax=Portunus trituberculatus TaxID=210409 RepID=A0A5B7GIC1_PORTR|nr:hypothetical protein [Portunus trituberculatus]